MFLKTITNITFLYIQRVTPVATGRDVISDSTQENRLEILEKIHSRNDSLSNVLLIELAIFLTCFSMCIQSLHPCHTIIGILCTEMYYRVLNELKRVLILYKQYISWFGTTCNRNMMNTAFLHWFEWRCTTWITLNNIHLLISFFLILLNSFKTVYEIIINLR